MKSLVLFVLLIIAAACQTQSQPLPAALADTAPQEVVVVAQQATPTRIRRTAVPTANRLSSNISARQVTSTVTPSPTITATPTNTATMFSIATNTPPPSATFTPTAFSVQPDNGGTPSASWTPPPPDPAVQIPDHYHFRRPVADTATNWVDRTYPYGGTGGRRFQVHHGVEFINPRGTPLKAVGDGVVLHAGDDLTTQFGPHTNYYGNLVVIQHNVMSPEGQPVFTLYGHMERVSVSPGQAVAAGDDIGTVGATGIALGPHLHFEVRVGNPYDFGSTRNPELWIRPYYQYGTLTGRVTDSAGNLLYDVTLTVDSDEITPRYAFSYSDNSVNPDPAFGENFTLGDLPAGWYTVTVGEGGRVRFQQVIYVYPDRSTFINVQLN